MFQDIPEYSVQNTTIFSRERAILGKSGDSGQLRSSDVKVKNISFLHNNPPLV